MDATMAIEGSEPSLVAGAEQFQVNPIDFKHLRRFTLGDRALEQEVLELFLGQLPETILSLRRAETEKDWRVAAHTLKGSGRAVGAWRLARLAEQAERMLGIRSADARVEALAKIEDAALEARTFITAAYGQQRAC